MIVVVIIIIIIIIIIRLIILLVGWGQEVNHSLKRSMMNPLVCGVGTILFRL